MYFIQPTVAPIRLASFEKFSHNRNGLGKRVRFFQGQTRFILEPNILEPNQLPISPLPVGVFSPSTALSTQKH
jgi:hypothetical protein